MKERKLTYRGITMSCTAWLKVSKQMGLPTLCQETINRRKRLGWSDERALTTPAMSKKDAGKIGRKRSSWGNFTINPTSPDRARKSGYRD